MRPASPKAILQAAKTAAFLVTNLTNVRYLSGMQMSAGAVLVTPRRLTLFADGRYLEQARQRAFTTVTVKDSTALRGALRSLARCGYEADMVTVAQLRRWQHQYSNTKFVQKTGVIEEFRRDKGPEELRWFRQAQRITQQMMRRLPKALRSGITERELAYQLLGWAIELGADELSFEPIVAFGNHSSVPHHHPTSRKLKRGDIVQIDVGARYKGYCADQSAVFFTAPRTKQQDRVYQAVERAQAAAVAAVKPGVTNHELDRLATDVLKAEGLDQYFIHSLGHGVGLDIHEGVSLSRKAKLQKLLKHEIVTIEPGVYLPGRFGIRLEREVVV